MIIYTTTKNGAVATRKSAGHREQKYFFAVWCGNSCQAYTSRRDLAEARVREFRGYKSMVDADLTIEPVTCELKVVKEKAAVDFPGQEFEMGGVKFGPDAKYHFARQGHYRGYTVRLSTSGKTFRAQAQPAELSKHDWAQTLYTKVPGSLQSRLDLIKRLVDEKLSDPNPR